MIQIALTIRIQSERKSSWRLSREIELSPILRGVHKENPMITVVIIILTVIFALGSISELLITEEMQDIVAIEQ